MTALCDLSTGNVLERYTYNAFGIRTVLDPDGSTVRNTSSYNMPFGYTSRQHDPETGLMYFRARYYDPSTGGKNGDTAHGGKNGDTAHY